MKTTDIMHSQSEDLDVFSCKVGSFLQQWSSIGEMSSPIPPMIHCHGWSKTNNGTLMPQQPLDITWFLNGLD